MHDKSLKELCEQLSISIATGRNWVKLGKITPQYIKNGMPYFDEKHFAIFISHTGENGRLVEIAKILKERKTKILVITANKNSTLTEIADDYLFASAPKTFQEFLFPAFYSSVKYILDILWGIEFSMEYEKNIKLNKVYDKIGEKALWGLLKKIDLGYTK